MVRNYKPFIATVTGWGGLGFYRGLNDYDYKYNKDVQFYADRKSKPKTYLYSAKFANGIWGWLVYMNPALSFLTIPNEIYRLEVKVRGLESEKTSDRYNELV